MNLFSSFKLGPLTLPNRLVMAPEARNRVPGHVPHTLMADYYGRRASAGLIVTETASVSPQGHAHLMDPGIYTDQQQQGWREVAEAVHAEKGRLYLQLGHAGRASPLACQPDGGRPVAPSPLACPPQGLQAGGLPRALKSDEIAGVVNDFRHAAARAQHAGFDGVSLQGVGGSLIDQFLRFASNRRTDAYGGSIQKRARFALEVVEAVTAVWGRRRVGIRLAPAQTCGEVAYEDPEGLFTYLVDELDRRDLAYVKIVEPPIDAVPDRSRPNHLTGAFFKRRVSLPVGSLGGHTPESALDAIESGSVDLVAFNRLFAFNPDLPRRIQKGAPLNRGREAPGGRPERGNPVNPSGQEAEADVFG